MIKCHVKAFLYLQDTNIIILFRHQFFIAEWSTVNFHLEVYTSLQIRVNTKIIKYFAYYCSAFRVNSYTSSLLLIIILLVFFSDAR